MKYLIIAALVGIVFVLVYSRVRPYLKLVRKVAAVSECRHRRQRHHCSRRRERLPKTSWFVVRVAGRGSQRIVR